MLQVNNIEVIYNHVILVLKGVSLEGPEGRIVTILGANGAGKSTLMKIIYGMIQPDSGTIEVFNKEEKFNSPKEAINSGIGMVHQHFMLVPVFSVTETLRTKLLAMDRARSAIICSNEGRTSSEVSIESFSSGLEEVNWVVMP